MELSRLEAACSIMRRLDEAKQSLQTFNSFIKDCERGNFDEAIKCVTIGSWNLDRDEREALRGEVLIELRKMLDARVVKTQHKITDLEKEFEAL